MVSTPRIEGQRLTIGKFVVPVDRISLMAIAEEETPTSSYWTRAKDERSWLLRWFTSNPVPQVEHQRPYCAWYSDDVVTYYHLWYSKAVLINVEGKLIGIRVVLPHTKSLDEANEHLAVGNSKIMSLYDLLVDFGVPHGRS